MKKSDKSWVWEKVAPGAKTATMLSNNHWTLATYRQRMTTKQWREVLLAGSDFIVFKGNPCHLKAKNIGAGVVEVYKDIPANTQRDRREAYGQRDGSEGAINET